MRFVSNRLSFCLVALLTCGSLEGCSSLVDNRQDELNNLLRSDKSAALVAYCDIQIAKFPDAPELYAYRALAKRRLGKFEEAKADMQKAISINPKIGWYYREMGNIYIECLDYKDAVSSLLKAKELMAGDASYYSVLSSLSQAYQRLGEYKESIDCATQSIALKSDEVYAYATRAMSYLHSFQAAKALADTDKCIQLDGKNPSAWAYHGWAALLTGDIKRAQSDCEKARSLNPKNWDELDLKMTLCLLQGDNAGALAAVDKAIEENPENALGYANKAHCLFVMKDLKQAQPLIEKSLEISPNMERSMSIATMIYAAHGDEAKAFEMLKREEPIKSESIAARSRCRLYFFLKKYEETIKQCNDALAKYPSDASLYRLRAEAYRRLGKSKEAEADMKEAYAKGYSKYSTFDLYLKAV